MNYDGYPEYEQLYPPFDPYVSVLDLLFNEGVDRARLLCKRSAPPLVQAGDSGATGGTAVKNGLRKALLEKVGLYYAGRLQEHGAWARGVDWNSADSQATRFDQLLKAVDHHQPFSINDYGCGYGALVDHILARSAEFSYTGFDISKEMTDAARLRHRENSFSSSSRRANFLFL